MIWIFVFLLAKKYLRATKIKNLLQLIIFCCLQVTKFKKYKSWNPKVRLCIVIVLSCPLIGCWATERANQRAAQNNYYIEPDFGVPSFVLLKLCHLYYIIYKFIRQTFFPIEQLPFIWGHAKLGVLHFIFWINFFRNLI